MKKIKLFSRLLTSYSEQDELEEEVNQFLRKLHEAGVKNITVTLTTHTINSEPRDFYGETVIDLYGEAVIMVTWDDHPLD